MPGPGRTSGIFWPASSRVIYTATFAIGTGGVPDEYQGTAGALLTTAQYLAGAVTLAVLTVVLAESGGYAGFTAAFAITAAAAGAGTVLAALRHRLTPRRSAADSVS